MIYISSIYILKKEIKFLIDKYKYKNHIIIIIFSINHITANISSTCLITSFFADYISIIFLICALFLMTYINILFILFCNCLSFNLLVRERRLEFEDEVIDFDEDKVDDGNVDKVE